MLYLAQSSTSYNYVEKKKYKLVINLLISDFIFNAKKALHICKKKCRLYRNSCSKEKSLKAHQT